MTSKLISNLNEGMWHKYKLVGMYVKCMLVCADCILAWILDDRKSMLDGRKCMLDDKKCKLDERKCMLDARKCMLDDKKYMLDDKKCKLNDRKCTLDDRKCMSDNRKCMSVCHTFLTEMVRFLSVSRPLSLLIEHCSSKVSCHSTLWFTIFFLQTFPRL